MLGKTLFPGRRITKPQLLSKLSKHSIHMPTVSARLPEALEEELEDYMEEEQLDRSVALRKLLSDSLEDWKQRKALELLEEGKVTLTRAAEMADMTIWEFADMVREEKVTWVKDERVEEDMEAA